MVLREITRRFRRLAVAAVVLLGVAVLAWGAWSAWRDRDDRQTIVFWGASFFGDEIYTVLHRFEQENPRYRVVVGASASRDLTGDAQRLLCAVAGEVPPDVIYFDRFAIGEWAARGALTDLTPLVAGQKADDPDRIDPSQYYAFALREASYAPPGSSQAPGLFGVPVSVDLRLLYANADHLRQAGIVDAHGNPKPPRTWEELSDAAVKLSRYDDRKRLVRLGFAPNFGNSWLYLFAWQAGGEMMNADRTRITMNSPPVARALKFMADVYDSVGGYGACNAFEMTFQGGNLDPFVRGQVSMKIDGTPYMDSVATWNRDMDFTVTPAPMPADRLAAGAKPVTWSGGFALVIPTTATNKDGAWKLIQYLTSWRTTDRLARGQRELREAEGRIFLPGGLGNRVFFERLIAEHIDNNRDLPAPFKRGFAVMREMLPHTNIRPVTPVGQLLWNQHIRAFEAGVNHRYRDEAKRLGRDEYELSLERMAEPVQQALDRVLAPPPPEVVNWTPYFVAYGLMVAAPFAAMFVVFRRRRKTHGYRGGDVRSALVMASPWLVGMIVFVGGPILFSIVMSFTRYDVLNDARYVGLANYRELAADPLLAKSLGNSLFMLLRIPVVMAVSLAVALLLNGAARFMGLYRTIVYLPTIMPIVAASLLWIWLLNPSQGAVNGLIQVVIDSPLGWVVEKVVSLFTGSAFVLTTPEWLQSERWSKPGLIVMNAWMCGGAVIIWLAGLQSIPTHLYEAAAIDGAGPLRRFRVVTLPLLSPFVLFNLIIGVIGTLQIFDEAYVMTNGGPVDSTMFYAFYLFRQAFQYFRMGYASAMAWVLFTIVLALTLLQLWLSKRWVHYEN